MMQSRTHTCGELRLADAGKNVTIVGREYIEIENKCKKWVLVSRKEV